MNAVPSPAEVAAFWASVARNHASPNEQDRFGLPIVGPSLLSPASQWQEVTAKCEALARDAFAAIEGLLGMPEARRIFRKPLKRPRAARRQIHQETPNLLAQYDSEVAKNLTKKRGAARRVAKRRHPEDQLQEEHLAHQSRKLAADRKATQQAQQELEAFLKSFLPSLLEEATDIKGD
jgi:hypothetical protein